MTQVRFKHPFFFPCLLQMRVEGFLPETGTPGTIGLHLYWNGVQTAAKDNYVTTNATVCGGPRCGP